MHNIGGSAGTVNSSAFAASFLLTFCMKGSFCLKASDCLKTEICSDLFSIRTQSFQRFTLLNSKSTCGLEKNQIFLSFWRAVFFSVFFCFYSLLKINTYTHIHKCKFIDSCSPNTTFYTKYCFRSKVLRQE